MDVAENLEAVTVEDSHPKWGSAEKLLTRVGLFCALYTSAVGCYITPSFSNFLDLFCVDQALGYLGSSKEGENSGLPQSESTVRQVSDLVPCYTKAQHSGMK